MKKNEKIDLKTKSEAELIKMVDDLRLEVAKTGMDIKLGKNKNTASVKEMKKTIARALTILGMKNIEGKEIK